MLWLILIGVVAVLLFVLLYKRPVNAPTWTPPIAPTEPTEVAHQPIQTFDLNDLYSGAHAMPQPPSAGDQPQL